MNDVKTEDLKTPARLLLLFDDAQRRGLVKGSEADKLEFFAAAEHAKRVSTHNMAGCFSALVRRHLSDFITHDDENIARHVLLRIDPRDL